MAFIIYSTVFIVCSPKHNVPYQPFCQSVVIPIWSVLSIQWHRTAEHVVLNLLPNTASAVTEMTKKGYVMTRKTRMLFVEFVLDTFNKAVQRGNMTEFESGGGGSSHPIDHNVPLTSVQLETENGYENVLTKETNSGTSTINERSLENKLLETGSENYVPIDEEKVSKDNVKLNDDHETKSLENLGNTYYFFLMKNR